MFSLRAVRSLRAALPKNNQIILPKTASRALSTSQRVFSERPPTLYGDGAKAGEVPSDLQQATGMERLQLLGQMEGIDVFNTGPLMMSKKGTLEDPTIVPSYAPERIVGCTGWPVESHDLIWITANNHKEHHRCPECGNVFKIQFLGEEHDHHHH